MTARENPVGAGNEQRRLEIRLAWLGGIIDGEGMVTVIRRKKGSRKGFIPRVSIVNTDERIISEVVSILKELRLAHYTQTKAGTKAGWKTKWEVQFNGHIRCAAALPHLIPYLVSKREKAEALLELCERRLVTREPYGERDMELIEKATLGNRTPIRSTTTRLAPKAWLAGVSLKTDPMVPKGTVELHDEQGIVKRVSLG